ncbi:MAG: 1-deoxy-D-xylulose-5-phosphate reductoisomerase [Acidobacteriota bacterium]|nr:1-deoxy-D-xylulose-5-phosphate reductoisomerase [Blastocatellia bacterium]MDW8238138.1 1-deoxy-D-xylulose-5-phosphate reductoisomerase [Acidobacteriota bacterium]
MKNVVILGSTGSIGENTLKVIEHLGGAVRVMALGAGRNLSRLAEQIGRFRPDAVSVAHEEDIPLLRDQLSVLGVTHRPRLYAGIEGLIELVSLAEADIIVAATVGAVGLRPTYRAIELGKRVALANKETLVIAGELMTKTAQRTGAELLPVDSEHNAIHQCLLGVNPEHIQRLILTASGGPFRQASLEQMQAATPEQALNHPTWQMGRKITIDSATLMNKGLEIIEATWLFGCGADKVDVVIHPQSLVHSMVEMIDGSLIAQLGVTDMRFAIQYALTFPERQPTSLPRLSFSPSLALEFYPPDVERFPCIRLAYQAATASGTMPTVLNAANEVAVQAFLDRRIGFMEIPQLIHAVMMTHAIEPVQSLDQLIQVDQWARQQSEQFIDGGRAASGRV